MPKRAQAKESGGSIYKVADLEISELSEEIRNEIQAKFTVIYTLICYIEGFPISKERFGPTLQGTKEVAGITGENCEPHVDCFQPSGKAFLYLTDVDLDNRPLAI